MDFKQTWHLKRYLSWFRDFWIFVRMNFHLNIAVIVEFWNFLGCEMDLVLVIDLSTTTNPIYKNYIEMSEQLINRLLIGSRYTRVALITFSSVGKTHTHFNLNKYFFNFWDINLNQWPNGQLFFRMEPSVIFLSSKS